MAEPKRVWFPVADHDEEFLAPAGNGMRELVKVPQSGYSTNNPAYLAELEKYEALGLYTSKVEKKAAK